MHAAQIRALWSLSAALSLSVLAIPAVSVAADFRLPDLDGDGDADIVLRHDDGMWRHFAVEDSRVTGTNSGPVRITGNSAWHPVAVGDFNGDGRDDFLLRRTDGRWGYYPMDGRQVLAEQRGWANLTTDLAWRPVATGDFNGDGRDDALLRRADGRWAYYPMDGKRVVVAGRGRSDLPSDPAWRMAAVADFDGDGRDDVLLRHRAEGVWQTHRMRGRQAQLAPEQPTLPANRLWRAVGAGDFDADGRAEVLLRHADGRWAWQPVSAEAPTAFPLSANWNWRFAGIGDLDGNGGDDVVVRHLDGRWRYASVAKRAGEGELAVPADQEWSLPAPLVHVADGRLRASIEGVLGKTAQDRITRRDLADMVELQAHDAGIRDLAGLRFATGLRRLSLDENRIADLSPLAGLPALEALSLESNLVIDLAPLAGATALQSLLLSNNDISELAPLSAMHGLEVLALDDNDIGDISALATLPRVRRLHLANNRVLDLTPLASRRRLTDLFLGGNGLTDISALAGLISLQELSLVDNRVKDLSPLGRAVRLRRLRLDGNPLGSLHPLEELPLLFSLSLNRTGLNDLAPLAALTALESLQLARNDLADISALGQLSALHTLRLSHNRVRNLQPLGNLGLLQRLYLDNNDIESVSALAPLEQLRTLDLTGNRIESIASLNGLRRLWRLELSGNRIRRLHPLAAVRSLVHLNLADNEVADVSPLRHLSSLYSLDLSRNAVVDIAPLEGLTALHTLNLAFNRVEDITPLVQNTGLGDGDRVDVRGNPLARATRRDAIAALSTRGVAVRSGNASIAKVHDHTVVVMQVDESISKDPLPDGLAFDLYASVFYTHFEDRFDYLLFFSNLDSIREHEDAAYFGIYFHVMNDTEGLGMDTFYRSSYGSAGRLRGVIHFPYNRALRNGPALHELQHAWSNFAVDTGWPAHWGFSSADGQLGGFDSADFADLGGGRYTAGSFGTVANGGNRPAYSLIELYYAGFVPPEEVPPLHVAQDGAWLRKDDELVRTDDGDFVFTATGVTTHTMEDLIALHGPAGTVHGRRAMASPRRACAPG